MNEGFPPPQSAVFLDLDGVVIDVTKRYFKLHGDIVAAIGGRSVEEETYWELKRAAASIEEIGGLSKEQGKEYRKRWNLLIESPAYLEFDDYLPQAPLAIKLLTSAYHVVVVSLRRKSAALRAQLKALSFPAVSQVLVATLRGEASDAKARLIQGSPYYTRNAVIVGDTEVDVRAGKLLGLTTVAVIGGLRSPEYLARESPDVTIKGIRELPAALRQLFAGGRP